MLYYDGITIKNYICVMSSQSLNYVQKDSSENSFSIENCNRLCSNYHKDILKILSEFQNDSILPHLTIKSKETKSLKQIYIQSLKSPRVNTTAELLHAIMHAEVESCFHKINVHAALTPSDIKCILDPIIQQAKTLLAFHKHNQIPDDNSTASNVGWRRSKKHNNEQRTANKHDQVRLTHYVTVGFVKIIAATIYKLFFCRYFLMKSTPHHVQDSSKR